MQQINSYKVLHFPINTASLAAKNNKSLQQIGVSSEACLIKSYKHIPTISNEGASFLSFNGLECSKGVLPRGYQLFPISSFRAAFSPQTSLSLKTSLVLARVWVIECARRVLNILPSHQYLQHFFASFGDKRRAKKLAFLSDVDIIHCYTGNLMGSAVEAVVRYYQLPGLAAWQGSEIRRPSIELQTNPYYHLLVLAEDGTSPYGDENRSYARQRKMYDLGFEPLVTAGMRQYILPEYKGPIHQIFHPVSLDVEPDYPAITNDHPVIVHAPSKRRGKGSEYVQKAIEQLRPLANFEYIEITGAPREEALSLMRRCDIYVDQMIFGDHGMAAIEAMSYGKPTVCYLKPSVCELLPEDIPIINATVDNLSEKLLELINDPQMRHDFGVASRHYVEKYHDPLKTAARLDEIYREILSRKQKIGGVGVRIDPLVALTIATQEDFLASGTASAKSYDQVV